MRSHDKAYDMWKKYFLNNQTMLRITCLFCWKKDICFLFAFKLLAVGIKIPVCGPNGALCFSSKNKYSITTGYKTGTPSIIYNIHYTKTTWIPSHAPRQGPLEDILVSSFLRTGKRRFPPLKTHPSPPSPVRANSLPGSKTKLAEKMRLHACASSACPEYLMYRCSPMH